YSETLKLMQSVGVNLSNALLRRPMTMQFADGTGLQLPDWRKPWMVGLDAAWGIVRTKGWSWADKIALLQATSSWQRNGFKCSSGDSVLRLCQKTKPVITPKVLTELIEPLCLSALNTPMHMASASVFLRVLQDALFAPTTHVDAKTIYGPANMLLPQRDLSNLFPHPAAAWLIQQGGRIQLGARVQSINYSPKGWQVDAAETTETTEFYDAVIFAGSASNMASVGINTAYSATNNVAIELQHLMHRELQAWQAKANALQYEAITTVYAYAPNAKLTQPMLALKTNASNPAQFVFDRGQLGGATGLLAFVISASNGDRLTLQNQVIAQGINELKLANLQAIQTIVEKRATFACTPQLRRPATQIAPGLLGCGDYIDGPYPATIEGAVRSAKLAVSLI
ncbi:MAG TPA: FAD-dependent oxidoreductase, partial [Burkholderiaceae bacterium]|nr:FAD-dependent oxidoreductase [Burkholderiaceae bacterium]